jgi:asparagine synthase (glutamine-hydrolysing)
MCGICGVFLSGEYSRDAAHEQREAVEAMTRLMARRGPDDSGFWQGERCTLGFRRLSILDLSPCGHQPMSSEDERFTLVFNGEVYNFRKLRDQLETLGHRFRSSGDSEVVLRSLMQWGDAALSRFNGMFALAFHDASTRTLLLARDGAGIKPLLYLQTAQGIVFASQLNQILAHPFAKDLSPDPSAVGSYLRFGFLVAPGALLENTHFLPAGSWLKLDENGTNQTGVFSQFPREGTSELRGEEAVDALDEAISRAVKRHLVSDVPVGVFLSGGIDSPLVAAHAQNLASTRLQAFTIGVPNDAADETSDAARYAQELNLEQIVRHATPQSALELLDDVVSASTEPTADFSIFPTLLVSKLASEHVKVVLSGDGGDELFWGYPSRFASAIEQAPHFASTRAARLAKIGARRLTKRGNITREVLDFPNLGAMYQKKHTFAAQDDLAALFPKLPDLPEDFHDFQSSATSQDDAAQWTRWNEFRVHLARVLLKVDRASMHHSLEVRVPLLDREVQNVAARTDWRSCLDLKNRRGKTPLRQALSRHVDFGSGGKRGFTIPMHDWLRGPLQPLLQERVLARRDFLGVETNPAQLEKLNAQLLAGDNDKAGVLWLLLSLALWEGKHWKA